MALGFGRSKNEDVVSLIASRDYGRAIEVLRAQLKKRGASPTLRKQLADVLVLSGKTAEAVSLLLPLADQFASEGFAAKAVAVLKKIQKLDPGRRDVEERLARLIEEKQREAVVLPLARPSPEIGIEEIGVEPPDRSPARPSPPAEDGGELELGFSAMPPVAAPAGPRPGPEEPAIPAAPAPPRPVDPVPPARPPSAGPEPVLSAPAEPLPEIVSIEEALPTLSLAAPATALPRPDVGTGRRDAASRPAAAPVTDEIEDYDLLYEGGDGDEDEEEITIEVEAVDEASPMTDGAFADELMSLVDSVFQDSPAVPAAAAPPPSGGSQIVVSPLFRDFAVDEMVAVIHGLKLLSFERGEVIIREGSAGGSLYTLTSGRVRAFRKDPATGRQVQIGDLREGAFFGEMSILTGRPRMASVVALTRCELLELDRATLDDITRRHPHVWDVLREFAGKRSPARG